MRKAHDRGGWPTEEPIDQTQHSMMDWERHLEAIGRVLPGEWLGRIDVARRIMESIPLKQYESLGYWDRRLVSMETRLIEEGILTKEEIDRKAEELEQRWGKK